ncbi:hypothetical protein Thivi_4372 [Thiocystis violascens DSM 198]|uniref:Uncharacterized protein n=1 Tax=Thiocystis violascens (strain ATCC 17096 / DSM 198 / 6111) TaxID=765911 RepID=I3YGQ9_THIV6|nr:hypothetical protein Thivi_4372 [Thiocystis violascens DSM 198]
MDGCRATRSRFNHPQTWRVPRTRLYFLSLRNEFDLGASVFVGSAPKHLQDQCFSVRRRLTESIMKSLHKTQVVGFLSFGIGKNGTGDLIAVIAPRNRPINPLDTLQHPPARRTATRYWVSLGIGRVEFAAVAAATAPLTFRGFLNRLRLLLRKGNDVGCYTGVSHSRTSLLGWVVVRGAGMLKSSPRPDLRALRLASRDHSSTGSKL